MFREVKQLTQGHTATVWQQWSDSTPIRALMGNRCCSCYGTQAVVTACLISCFSFCEDLVFSREKPDTLGHSNFWDFLAP